MKSNLAAILLVLACLGLGVVLWTQNQKHVVQTQDLNQTINTYSSNITTLKGNLARVTGECVILSNNLEAAKQRAASELAAVKADLSTTSASLQKTEAEASSNIAVLDRKLQQQLSARATLETDLAALQRKAKVELDSAKADLSVATVEREKAQAEAKAAADEIAKATAAIAEKTKRIDDLEKQNAELDKEASDLRTAMANVDARMQATQKKMDAAAGDQKLLMAELKQAEAQKEELEKKFSDVTSLKKRVRDLKDDAAVALHVDYIRRGLYEAGEKKAGEYMMAPPAPAPAATNHSLVVDLHENGAATIKTPAATPAGTNAPSARGPSAAAPAPAVPGARGPGSRQPPDLGL
jgi:chromosome segregation ATPase